MSLNSYKLSATSIILDTENFDYSYARTPPTGDISTKIATTEFITNGFLPLSGGTITGNLIIAPTGSLIINNSNGFIINNNSTLPNVGYDNISLEQNNILRWTYGKNNDAENGSNSGSNFYISSYKDDGSYNNTPLSISRSNGIISISTGIEVPTVSKSDNSLNSASTQWVNNQNYVKGDLDLSTNDKIGLGLFYQGSSNLPCFVYNNGSNDVLVTLSSEEYTDGRYLKLTGGTLTGELDINSNLVVSGNVTLTGSNSILTSNRGNINYTPSVGDQSSNIANTQFVYNSLKNYVSSTYAIDLAATDYPGLGLHFQDDGTPIGVYEDSSGVLHTPQLSTEAWSNNNFLQLTGGNLSGSLTISQATSYTQNTLDLLVPSTDKNIDSQLGFHATFDNPTVTDTGQRLVSVIQGSFAQGSWGTEQLRFWINNGTANDEHSLLNMTQIMILSKDNITVNGGMIINGTGTVNLSNGGATVYSKTPPNNDNSTQVATTAFVQNQQTPTITTSGSPGEPGCWTVIKYPDISTPSGYRIRMMGETAAYYRPTRQTITFPEPLNGIFPGAYGVGTKLYDGNTSGRNDQAAQLNGTPTTTSMIIYMNEYGGGTYIWPIYATWWIEGY